MSHIDDEKVNTNSEAIIQKSKNPLVFISHDTRDSEVAECFSKLLSSVSAGVLKSFRSSDRTGTQGIEYGIEWYPEIMKKLDEATDVVCLLTQNSTNRPWILYEAGVAKGKLNTTLLGIAIGIPLAQANSGPFALFQNCADDEESLTKLVMQLVRRIPNSEPDIDVIKAQVALFISKAKEVLTKPNKKEKSENKIGTLQDPGVAKLFEEIKLMYSELPERVRRVAPETNKEKFFRFTPSMLEELLYINRDNYIGFIIVLSLFKNDFPWIYDSGMELIKQIKTRSYSDGIKKRSNYSINRIFSEFRELFDFTFGHPLMRELYSNSYQYRLRELQNIIYNYIDRLIHETTVEAVESIITEAK